MGVCNKNRITQWQVPTKILYAGKDHLTDRDTVEAFTKTYNCELTIWETGEHWFHTQPQLDFYIAGWTITFGPAM